jgi:hypothetical protein
MRSKKCNDEDLDEVLPPTESFTECLDGVIFDHPALASQQQLSLSHLELLQNAVGFIGRVNQFSLATATLEELCPFIMISKKCDVGDLC